MRGKAFAAGTKAYLMWLVRTAIFPLVWAHSFRMARQHEEDTPHGRRMLAFAILASIAATAVGANVLLSVQASADEGFYDHLDNRLAVAVGETAYQDLVTAWDSANNTVVLMEEKVAQARAEGNATKEAEMQASLDAARADQADLEAQVEALRPNHELYRILHQQVMDRDDAAAKQTLATTSVTYEKMIPKANWAFQVKDDAQADMAKWMKYLFWPGLIGVFFAPLVWAVGRIHNGSYEESDTVGYKKYPSTGGAWFLLLGAMGIPALFFAAWMFWDIDVREQSGQISL